MPGMKNLAILQTQAGAVTLDSNCRTFVNKESEYRFGQLAKLKLFAIVVCSILRQGGGRLGFAGTSYFIDHNA
jgi:hypothetical protein